MAPSAPAAAPRPDLDFDLAGSSSGGGGGAAPSAPAPSFDLDLDSHKQPASHEAPAASGLDFDLAPTGGAAPRMDVPAEAKEEKPAFDFDLSGLDMAKSSSGGSGGGGMDLADINLEATASGAGGEAVGTKLELAKAYLEIGDKDGAREILHEVAKEGSSAQKEEAKKLIASL